MRLGGGVVGGVGAGGTLTKVFDSFTGGGLGERDGDLSIGCRVSGDGG